MSLMSKRLTFIFLGLLPACVSAACFPPNVFVDSVEQIDMFLVGEDRLRAESSVTWGQLAGAPVLRLSRQYYEITIVGGLDPSFSRTGILLGTIRADTSILDDGPGVVQLASFVAERTGVDIQLVCMDDSILSEQLLREEVVFLIQIAG